MVSSVVSAIFGFLSAAVFTRLLSPAEYGVFVVGVSVAGFVSATLFTWVRYSAMRFQSEGPNVDVRLTSLVAFGFSAAMLPVAFVLISSLSHMTWQRVLLALALSFGLSLFELGQELLRSRLQVRAFLIGSVLRSALAFGLCVVIARLGGGGLGQLAGLTLAYLVTSLFSARQIWLRPLAAPDPAKLRLFVVVGLSITAAGFVVALQSSLDRLFLAWLQGDTQAGLYGASADIVRQIILIPAGSVAAAAFPLTMRALARGGREEASQQLARTGELLLSVLAPATFGLALTAPYLASFLIGPSFRDTACAIMPILAFAWLFQSLSQSYIQVSFHMETRPALALVQSLGTLCVNAIVLWPLTQAWGVSGTATSLLLSEGAGVLFGLALTRYGHPLPLLFGPAARVLVACGAMATVVVALERALPIPNLPTFLVLAGSGGAVYLLVAFALNICDARRNLGELIAKARSKGPWPQSSRI